MARRYVIDTCVLVNYFGAIFGEATSLSPKIRELLDMAFAGCSSILISIPAVVFVEVFDKWFASSDFASRFHYEIYAPLTALQNVEIRQIDREILEIMTTIATGADGVNDVHDRIVLASAMALACPLLTMDAEICTYVSRCDPVPGVYS